MATLRPPALARMWSAITTIDCVNIYRSNPVARRWALGTLALIVIGSAAGLAWSKDHKLIWNESNSLPDHVYYADKSIVLQRMGLIAFYPRPDPIVTFHFGKRPVPFVKRIYGIAGDLVTHGPDAQVAVNGVNVARMKPFTYFHERLIPGPTGPVPKGCFYVGSPHADGFDSRYKSIGWVCQQDVIGGAKVVL